jgi:hypothetical protein
MHACMHAYIHTYVIHTYIHTNMHIIELAGASFFSPPLALPPSRHPGAYVVHAFDALNLSVSTPPKKTRQHLFGLREAGDGQTLDFESILREARRAVLERERERESP